MKNMRMRMISVCMATYNGERWIEEQLQDWGLSEPRLSK